MGSRQFAFKFQSKPGWTPFTAVLQKAYKIGHFNGADIQSKMMANSP